MIFYSHLFLDLELKKLFEMYCHLEKEIEKKVQEFEEEVNHQIENIDDDEENDDVSLYKDSLWDEYQHIHDRWPQYLRRSMCLLVYELFERKLISLCRDFSQARNIDDDTLASLEKIDDCKKYMKRNFNVEPGKALRYMASAKSLRNCIAHYGACLNQIKSNKKCQKIESFIDLNLNRLELRNSDEVFIKRGFIQDLIENFIDSFNEIFSSMDEVKHKLTRPKFD